jgi:hypothetical protein
MIETVIPCMLCFIAGAIISPLLYLHKLCKKPKGTADSAAPEKPTLKKDGVFDLPLYNGLYMTVWDSFAKPGYIAVSIGSKDSIDGDVVYFEDSHISLMYGRQS